MTVTGATRRDVIVLRGRAEAAGNLELAAACDRALRVNGGYMASAAEAEAAWDVCERVIAAAAAL